MSRCVIGLLIVQLAGRVDFRTCSFLADATEQAETDTAAQEVANPEMGDQSKGGATGTGSASAAAAADHPDNGMLAGPQHRTGDGHGALTPSPRKRRTPRRVPTGLFSVNSSDLLGCGFSNLGNSGLVVGDLDVDRKGEVDQRPSKKRPLLPGAEADTISEQGDTDRYLKSVNAEDATEPWRHTRVPRQNSMTVGVTDGGGITKDARSLMGEIQHLQQNQGVMRSALESQKRTAAESELLIGCGLPRLLCTALCTRCLDSFSYSLRPCTHLHC